MADEEESPERKEEKAKIHEQRRKLVDLVSKPFTKLPRLTDERYKGYTLTLRITYLAADQAAAVVAEERGEKRDNIAEEEIPEGYSSDPINYVRFDVELRKDIGGVAKLLGRKASETKRHYVGVVGDPFKQECVNLVETVVQASETFPQKAFDSVYTNFFLRQHYERTQTCNTTIQAIQAFGPSFAEQAPSELLETMLVNYLRQQKKKS